MSQHYPALQVIAKEAGLEGKLLRPLSAKSLPKTLAEKKGIIDREKLLNISGRSRKPQFALAKEYDITTYPSPAGGCLLTCEEYTKKLQDLFDHKKRISIADVTLLRVGRHFREGTNKFIVGRNEGENKFLVSNKLPSDYMFELPKIVGPVTLLQGKKNKTSIETAAKLTAFYSDAETGEVAVNFGRENLDKSIKVSLVDRGDVERLRVGNQESLRSRKRRG
jgi:gamma-glutamyltranspeptidase